MLVILGSGCVKRNGFLTKESVPFGSTSGRRNPECQSSQSFMLADCSSADKAM